MRQTCADPESFVRGGPTFSLFFKIDERRDIADPNTTIRGTRETPLKWRFSGVPMMAQH